MVAAEGFAHISVMPDEVLEYLQPKAGGIYVDGTLGGAGHAGLILEKTNPDGRLIGFDRDPEALATAGERLSHYGERFVAVHDNFSEAMQQLARLGIDRVDGMLLDLGVSSWQLDSAARGFSFREDGPLDMRMNPTEGESAAELLNELDEQELVKIFFTYGEERYSRRIARAIVARRVEEPWAGTLELAELIRDVVPKGRVPSRIHPATRVFMALRIQVNRELEHVERGVSQGIELLARGGRLVVISFHSLEDRLVKNMFREAARSCICPPEFPVCACEVEPKVKVLTRKAIKATAEEIAINSRSRSAVLRAVERL
ncbi:MAG: 16S rRNA (cytosine(1402)-N(4))-methyltransferase [Desulfuromonas sp.]|mgnify:CR=1 FL=1|nr:MAG: 16S rRNA (cytosine(1402)-N(4))-methyltransferase [Desulfuromonas sp.]